MFCAEHLYRPACLLAFLLAHGVIGQELPVGPSTLLMKSGTPVKLRLAQTICSADISKNDHLEFVVVQDVIIGGFTVVQTGALARGSVVGVEGKRLFGMGGSLVIRLEFVELANGQRIQLVATQKFKGRSHTVRMGLQMAIAGAIYWPAAPIFLLARGRERTVLKGTDFTAYTKADSSVATRDLTRARENVSELSEMINLLPPRVLNGEGREGDMVNLIFLAKEDDLREAFALAGWLEADKSVPRVVWRLMWRRKHYKELPMDKLYIYGRPQDYSFVLPDPKLIVARRHHVRIWRTGREVDGIPLWVGAATHDVSIEFVKHRFRLYHRIDPNVDAERDFIARNLAKTWPPAREEFIACAEPVLSAHTATGQSYHSDGRMLFVKLNQRKNPVATEAEVAGISQ